MKSKILALSKNEEFKSILSGKKISNKYNDLANEFDAKVFFLSHTNLHNRLSA